MNALRQKCVVTLLPLPFHFACSASLVPRPHLFMEVGLVNNALFLDCAESAVRKKKCSYQSDHCFIKSLNGLGPNISESTVGTSG